jgi:hypothetical protein
MDTFGTLSYIEFETPKKYPTYFNFDGRYIYLTSTHNGTTDLVRHDPFTIVPSIKSTIIANYSDITNEPKDVPVSPIEQDQVFDLVLKAGEPNHIFQTPLKNLIWELRFETGAIMKRTIMRINDVVLFDEDYLSLFVLRPFQNHIITPTVPIGLYKFRTPVNFSRIRYPSIEIWATVTEDTVVRVTAKAFNVLTCSGGTGGLLFN